MQWRGLYHLCLAKQGQNTAFGGSNLPNVRFADLTAQPFWGSHRFSSHPTEGAFTRGWLEGMSVSLMGLTLSTKGTVLKQGDAEQPRDKINAALEVFHVSGPQTF